MSELEKSCKRLLIDDSKWDLEEHFKYRVNKYVDFVLDKIPYGWRIYDFYRNIRLWFVSTYQKFRYGVSNEECWSLDFTVAEFTLKRLRHFKKMRRFGVPMGKTEDEWEAILDELIWTFDYTCDDTKYNPIPHVEDIMKTFEDDYVKSPEEELAWKEHFKIADELNERKRKGLILFAEVFENLWD